MKLPKISYDEMNYLIRNGVVKIENRTKYKKEARNFAMLLFSLFLVLMFPLGVILRGLVIIDFYNSLAWCFLIFFLAVDILLFKGSMGYYSLYKYPEEFFWKYFIKKKFELKFLGTVEERGKKYAVHGFVNESCVLSTCAFMLLKIKKDVHKKAMALMKGGEYEIAFDANGKEKVVIHGGNVVDVNRDTLLVMKLISTIYALYGEDINKIWVKRYGETEPRTCKDLKDDSER